MSRENSALIALEELKNLEAQRVQKVEDEARAKEEAERVLANRSEAHDLEEAQQQLMQATAQLQALERLRKAMKH